MVSYIKCGRVQSWHTRTLLARKVLGRRIGGCRRALPRAQLGAPGPQARESDVGRARPSVCNCTPSTRVVSASRHSHLERRRGHVKLIDFGTSKDLVDSTLNGPELCGNQPVSHVLAISAPRPWFQLKLGHDLRAIPATVSREQHLAPTPTNLKLKPNLNFRRSRIRGNAGLHVAGSCGFAECRHRERPVVHRRRRARVLDGA